MEHIRYDVDGAVAIITMARGKANAFNTAMVEELHQALSKAGDPAVRAVVLASDTPKFFSAGFDVGEVFLYDRMTLEPFLQRYGEFYARLQRLEKPTLAALNGHAFAGGAILALSCDFRVMAQGDFGFALNEINVGIPLPATVVRMLAGVVGLRHAREMILTGDAVAPARALEIGLVDELVPAETLLLRVKARARALATKPAAAYASVKHVLRRVAGHDADGEAELRVDHWFTPEAEERKRAILATVKK